MTNKKLEEEVARLKIIQKHLMERLDDLEELRVINVRYELWEYGIDCDIDLIK